MAKKKTTMTLKDFHGGSIPSDIPLPSAPGLSARPPDRPGPWGPAAIATVSGGGRTADHQILRPRPGSAGGGGGSVAGGGGGRGFDERPPSFLSHPAHIGRHFDEDERKPFDASSVPRRGPAVDPARQNPSSVAVAGVGDRSVVKRPSIPVLYPPAAAGLGAGVSSNLGSLGAAPNAWGVRKESVSVNEPLPVVASASTPVPWSASRIGQTSAVEKVLSGRWQSKPPPDVEVIRFQEVEVLEQRLGESVRVVDDSERRYYELERPRSGSAVGYGEGKDRNLQGLYSDRSRDQERGRYGMHQQVKERNAAAGSYNSGVRPASAEGRFNASKVQQQAVTEGQERPKLKLLPRTRQQEFPDTHAPNLEDKHVYQRPVSIVHHEIHGSANTSKLETVVEDEGSRLVERPKLNLKPRTQTVEQPVGVNRKERETVFGGARPRELVLKERGIDVVVNEPDLIVHPNRNDSPKTDPKLETQINNQFGERGNLSVGQKTGRDDKKGHRPDSDKVDATRVSWRNDNRKNTREIEKPTEHQRADTETWRKPVEQPKPEASGARFGKAASPLELAQAFSRSVSETNSDSHVANERNLPGRSQVPFSRLTDNRELYPRSAQKQINGY